MKGLIKLEVYFKAAVPNLFWHQGPVSWKTVFSQSRGWGDGSGGNASDGERWGAAGEALLAHPPLTSCGPVPKVCGRGVGDPCPRGWARGN